MTSMKIFHFSRPPTPFVHLRPKFFHPFDLGRPISNDSPLQMITNQLKEKIIQGWLLYVIRSFLQVGFRFQYQPINLVWLSFDFFSFSWSLTISFFVVLWSCVCKYPKMSRDKYIFICIHIFSTHFAINLLYLHNLKTWANYGTTTSPCMWTNEIKTKTKLSMSRSNWSRVILFDLVHKQCNGIIKGWIHCLTSESKDDFLSIMY